MEKPMNLSPATREAYTSEHLTALEAQRAAEYIAFAPIVFQVSRLMVKWGILEMLDRSSEGLTVDEVAQQAGISEYAATVLLEASLSIGTVLVDPATSRYTMSKTGWFLVNDPATRVNLDFNHDVNYMGMMNLDKALTEGCPAGLKSLGDWPTIYEGLSQLPSEARRSWFAFDHFYSDSSFDAALEVVFENHPARLLDVGGNTGRWALRCVAHDPTVKVTIVDLPQQIAMMREHTAGKPGGDRIDGHGMDLLDPQSQLPTGVHYDALWMSQFLDCFSPEQIVSILERAASIMDASSRLYIMETLWDRQRFEPAAMCLTLTSLYFTCMANGNSKMYHSDQLSQLVDRAGLTIERIVDDLGQGHSIMIVKKK